VSRQVHQDILRRIGELQERAARAVPAAVQERKEGCWLRYTDATLTWWSGAALLHDPAASPPLAARLAAAEDFYASHRVPTQFQVCPACPPGLDDALAASSYALRSVILLEVASTRQIADHLRAPVVHIDRDEQLDTEWFRLLMAAQGSETDVAAEWRLLQRVDWPSAYATVSICDEPVAVGRAVSDTGWVGVFNMATLPAARGRGAGRAVLSSLADWAVSRGAEQMYLQVERNNVAARNLYERAGFTELCSYHYRTAAPC
jgi:GNAT superfamily N-acetyltransferase